MYGVRSPSPELAQDNGQAYRRGHGLSGHAYAAGFGREQWDGWLGFSVSVGSVHGKFGG